MPESYEVTQYGICRKTCRFPSLLAYDLFEVEALGDTLRQAYVVPVDDSGRRPRLVSLVLDIRVLSPLELLARCSE